MDLRISKTTLIKGVILAITLATVLVLRFAIIPKDRAGPLVVDLGYYFLAANFSLFLYSLARNITVAKVAPWLSRHAAGLMICVALSVVVHQMEPHRFKVLNDEFALLNNSMAMHLYQKAGLMGQADLVDGERMHPSFSADKRSLTFQFLLSLVHRLTGYRPENAFLLNALLTTGFFIALYGFLNWIQENRILAIGGVLLAASIPLYAQVATSGAYDLLNILLILAFMIAGTAYVRSPDASHQGMFVMTGLLLAQARYESLLYLLSLGAITLLVWIREKEIRLSWISVVSPGFLFIPLMSNAHMFAHETLQDASARGGTVAFMSLTHIPANLVDAALYFFYPYSSPTHSLVVSVLSLCGFIWLGAAFYRNRGAFMTPARMVYIAVLPVCALCFLFMTTNFWGKLTDPMASRFAMPLYLMGILAAVLCLQEICQRYSLQKWILAGMGILFVTVSSPRILGYTKTPPMIRSEYHQWVLDFADSKSTEPVLFSCDGTLGLVAYNKAVIPIKALNISPDAIAGIMQSGLYDSIYVFDLSVPGTQSGNWINPPGSTGLDTDIYAAEIEQEVYFSGSARARAYRLTGIYAH